MEKRVEIPPNVYRIDPLTGAGNILAFFEWLKAHTQKSPIPPYTLISLDIKDLQRLNDTHGQAAGDAAIRWASFVLKEEAGAQVFRFSGDEFVGVLIDGTPDTQAELFDRVVKRLSSEAGQVELTPPAALVSMIHYTGLEDISPEDLLRDVYGSLLETKRDTEQSFKVFQATAILPAVDVSGAINHLVDQLVSLGTLLDKSRHLAYTDPISGLPNMLPANQELERAITAYHQQPSPCSILLVDGDDLGRYNSVSYLAGDEMIANIAEALKQELRPRDFVARWRTGDEFLIILHNTEIDQAERLSHRISTLIQATSKHWQFSITVSIGITSLKHKDTDANTIINRVENALKRAKDSGKNRIEIES